MNELSDRTKELLARMHDTSGDSMCFPPDTPVWIETPTVESAPVESKLDSPVPILFDLYDYNLKFWIRGYPLERLINIAMKSSNSDRLRLGL